MLRAWLQIAYRTTTATPAQLAYNKRVSALQEAVKWTYKDLKQLWASQDFKRDLKTRQAPIGLLYEASALLWTFHVCMCQRGQTQIYFNTEPPTLSKYVDEQ